MSRAARVGVVLVVVLAGAASPPAEKAGGAGSAEAPPVVFVSPTGSTTGTCTLQDPCQSFDRAYHRARPGDTVSVAAGTYPMTEPAAGATTIFPDPAKPAGSSPVTFTCSGEVGFEAPNFVFYPGTRDVTFRGSCFRFHVVVFGYGGTAERTRSVTLDSVRMDSFQITGADRITIRNSEIGPSVYCYGPSQPNVPESGRCRASEPAEAYWTTQFLGSSNQQMQPFVHSSKYAMASNIVLEGNRFHDLQTRDSGRLHTGGLLVWDGVGITIRGNRFERAAVRDIQFSGGPTAVVIERNWFGYPVEPMDNGQPNGIETSKDFREVAIRSEPGRTYSNWLIGFNSFVHGLSVDNSAVTPAYANFRVIRNILGVYSYCPPGPTWYENMTAARGDCQSLPVPYGYALTSERLLLVQPAADVVRRIFREAAAGAEPREIARSLRRPGQGGGRRWTAGAVRRVLETTFYLGKVVGPPGAHPALVSRAKWRAAQRTLRGAS